MMGLECLQALVDFFPIHETPPGGQVFRTPVIDCVVVGMLQDIVAENGKQALGIGVVLFGCSDDLHLAAWFAGKPNPAAAELFGASIVKLGLEIFEVAKSGLDDFGDRTAGFTAA